MNEAKNDHKKADLIRDMVLKYFKIPDRIQEKYTSRMFSNYGYFRASLSNFGTINSERCCRGDKKKQKQGQDKSLLK
jgi:hypothetical protein